MVGFRNVVQVLPDKRFRQCQYWRTRLSGNTCITFDTNHGFSPTPFFQLTGTLTRSILAFYLCSFLIILYKINFYLIVLQLYNSVGVCISSRV